MTVTALLRSECPDLRCVARGKVRDLYEVDDNTLLFVATDRISAFDVIMNNGIPRKGELLTQLSVFWFQLLADVIPNHLITADINEMPAKIKQYRDQLEGRCLLVKKLEVLPIEAIVRGYITGSAWKEYQKKSTICDIRLPSGLKDGDRLDTPIFTPSTKAKVGQHDENIHPSKVADIIGDALAKQIERISLKLYEKASEHALERGITIADTKFEFGIDESGDLYLIDEVLTPDSSRFWPMAKYMPGKPQTSFDKQYLRDYLHSIGFDQTNGVELPQEIIESTFNRYQEAYELLTGRHFHHMAQ